MKILTKAKHCHVDMSPTCSLASLARKQVDVQMIVTESGNQDVDKLEYQKPAYVAVGLILAMTMFAVFFPMVISSSLLGMSENVYEAPPAPPCADPCRFSLVESIPENLTFAAGSPVHLSTYMGWQELIASAKSSIDIASFYWTLRGADIYEDPSDWQGEKIFHSLQVAARDRGIKLRIAQNIPDPKTPNYDTAELNKLDNVEVRSLNFTRWFGGGVLHTKLWIIDNKHFYVGSANMDWRSLTQVKELGVIAYNCSCLAEDVDKLFSVYWLMGKPGATIPAKWPASVTTNINMAKPLFMYLNDTPAYTYLSSSPPEFCPRGRSGDIDSILDVISKADKFIHIAVMDYFPTTLYTRPRLFWPVIDDALRRASLERGVEVRVMASWWNHSRPDLPSYLTSLQALSGAMNADIQVKLFHVPAFTPAQQKIPFGRVNHNKYMVTDNAAYIGTSNWSGDYFISTGGVGIIVNQTEALSGNRTTSSAPLLQEQLAAIFERDWNSTYARRVKERPRRRGLHTLDYNMMQPEM